MLIIMLATSGCEPTKPEYTTPPKNETQTEELPKPDPIKIEPTKPIDILPETVDTNSAAIDSPETINQTNPLPKSEPKKTEIANTELSPPPPSPKDNPKKTKISKATAFHDKCAYILNNFVNNEGMISYKTLKRKKQELKTLLSEFDELDPTEYSTWPKEDKIALWINAYNIQMLKIIIENYPIKSSRYLRILWPPTSIRHIPPIRSIGASKWDLYKLIVMDEQFTLSEIEKRFFHKEFDDPKVFFALSMASLSGPPLQNKPYYGNKLQSQLDDRIKKFLASPHGFAIDRNKQIVYLSAIFQPDWYGQSFLNKYSTDKKFKDHPQTTRAVLNFITNYTSNQNTHFLELENYSIKYISYDWRLNE